MRFLTALLCAPVLFAAPEWVRVRSANFEVVSNAGAKDARYTAEYFEQVRDFFLRVKSGQLTTRLPVTIVLFRSQKDYQPYAPGEGTAAFFIGDESRDFIVMGGTGDDHKPVAVHEYMHLLVKGMGLDLPVWLNEGVAEVYSTLRPYAGKIAVGTVPRGRVYSLAQDKWFPLRRLFQIKRTSPEYNEENRMGILYAQSWLLTHMLMLDPKYSPEFGNLMTALDQGKPIEDALQVAYGGTVDDLERELQSYYRRGDLKAALFNTKLEKIKVGEAEPAEPHSVEVTLARVVGLIGRREEAAIRFERLAESNPKDWEVHEALGNLAWRRGDLDGARKHLKKAVDLNPSAWHILWDYARVAQADEASLPSAVAALKRTLELNGILLEARLLLGNTLLRTGDAQGAYDTLKPVRHVTPKLATRLFLGMAHAAVRLEKYDEARDNALQAKKYSKEPADTASAESILNYLERRETLAKAGHKAASIDGPSITSAAPLERKPEEVLAAARGLLETVTCDVNSATLTVLADQRRLKFLIADPDKILIRDKPGSTMTLTCGKQPAPTRILVEYSEKAPAGVDGEVRVLEFLTP